MTLYLLARRARRAVKRLHFPEGYTTDFGDHRDPHFHNRKNLEIAGSDAGGESAAAY
jgi:hypothetical protein